MFQPFNIQYLHHHEINKVKWDNCLDKADNGLIYGYSFYLDHMARHWDALVLNNYQAVMPLTWNKKYGIHYLYQPFLCAQLGVFGKNIDTEISKAFLKAIPSKFKYWDIYLNHQNILHLKDFDLYLRNNFVLNLNLTYDDLYKGYRENVKRNVKKAYQFGCVAQTGFSVEQVIELAQEQMKSYSVKKIDFENFRKLYHLLRKKKQAVTYGIFKKDQLLASCVFFFSHNRAYYILVGNHPDGRTMGASHALIDAFIKNNAATNLLLDFEGSDIRDLAFFYSSFGAIDERYAAVRLNHLPRYLKWIKK